MLMRIVVLFALVGWLQAPLSHAQSITFTLYLHDVCADTVGEHFSYSLHKGDSSYSPTYPNGTVYLSELGAYRLSTVWLEGYREYYFSEYTTIIDTVKLASIYLCFEGGMHPPTWSGYCCCGERCEGNLVEYYSDGTKRMEGNFRNGEALGQVRSYYPNGQLYQRATYFPRGNLLRRITYDPDGEVKSRENVIFYPIYRLINELENLGS